MGRPLVLVPGHGVCVDPGCADSEAAWVGIYAGEAPALVEQIRRGVEAAHGEGALLIFSGGATRRGAGRLSEGQSYWDVAAAAGWWGHAEQEGESFVEGYARDSLENLGFGLARFRELQGAEPAALTIVAWAFKERRFGLHYRTLGLDLDYRYVGVNDPAPGPPLDQARLGEAEKCAALEQDPWLRGPDWERQRQQRDPFGIGAPYDLSGPRQD